MIKPDYKESDVIAERKVSALINESADTDSGIGKLRFIVQFLKKFATMGIGGLQLTSLTDPDVDNLFAIIPACRPDEHRFG